MKKLLFVFFLIFLGVSEMNYVYVDEFFFILFGYVWVNYGY